MTTFVFPTLANPAALNERELRVELERVNQQVLSLSGELNEVRYASQRLAGLLARVVTARTMKKQDELNSIVDEIIEKYVRVMPPTGKGKVH